MIFFSFSNPDFIMLYQSDDELLSPHRLDQSLEQII